MPKAPKSANGTLGKTAFIFMGSARIKGTLPVKDIPIEEVIFKNCPAHVA
jgi:hypothetical protein